MRPGRRLSSRPLVDFVRDDEPVVIGLDDAMEPRWGTRIKGGGIYRDPVARRSLWAAVLLGLLANDAEQAFLIETSHIWAQWLSDTDE